MGANRTMLTLLRPSNAAALLSRIPEPHLSALRRELERLSEVLHRDGSVVLEIGSYFARCHVDELRRTIAVLDVGRHELPQLQGW